MKVDIISEALCVEDQKDYGICYPLSIREVMSILYRRLDPELNRMVLSHQSLLDQRCRSNPSPLLQPPNGLQTVEAYPVTWTIPDDVVARYKKNEPKYCIKDMREHFRGSSRNFKDLLEANFGPNGTKSPMIGSMYMSGRYEQQTTFEPQPIPEEVVNQPYFGNIDKDEELHAMVIVGVDTDNGKDYCTMKNSYGLGWGRQGFGQVHIKDIWSIEQIWI